MVKRPLRAALALLAVALPAGADPESRDRILKHFGGWYSFYPNSRVSVSESADLKIPGFEAYRVQRQTDSKRYEEAGIALHDAAREQVFVGRVLHDSVRAASGRRFDPLVDSPDIEKHLSDAFGLPASLVVKSPRGDLLEAEVRLRQKTNVWLALPGYVSSDGASVLIGEFQPLGKGPEDFRRRLLAESPGVRLGAGEPTVAEFIDFQCDRCRKRAPEVKAFVQERGGSVEIRFFPLVKIHPWAFAAAESASALAAISPRLYEAYESALFERAETMSEGSARQLAADHAEAAGKTREFSSEITSGRARDRVLADLRLGARLGITGTPYFIYDGTLVPGEAGLIEKVVSERSPAPPKVPAR